MDEMVKLRVVDNRFQADLWQSALQEAGVPFLFRTYQDTAYDGLFVSQKGFGVIFVDEACLAQAQELDRDLAEAQNAAPMTIEQLASCLDHTLLNPAVGMETLQDFLAECRQWQVAAACVLPWMAPAAKTALEGSGVAVCSVVDFPLGALSGPMKRVQALELLKAGCDELDVVINRALIADGLLEQAVAEIADLARAAAPARTKVIIESGELGPELAARVAAAFVGTGVAFIKTGSGFFAPADEDEVANLRAAVGEGLAIKAAGGIKTLDQALALLNAGADRLGASAAASILQEAAERWE